MNPYAEAIRQHDTHSMLTPKAGLHNTLLPRLDLDAIVVPASRPSAHLDHAVTLARAAGCWLLILCSGRLDRIEAVDFLAARSCSASLNCPLSIASCLRPALSIPLTSA